MFLWKSIEIPCSRSTIYHRSNIVFEAIIWWNFHKIILLLWCLRIKPHQYLHLNAISPSFFLFFSTFCLFFSFPFQSWSLVILKCFFEIVNISYTFMFPENVLEQHYLTIQKTKSLFWCITTIYNFTELEKQFSCILEILKQKWVH